MMPTIHYDPAEPHTRKLTRWKNPTKTPLSIRVLLPREPGDREPTHLQIDFPPGEVVPVPTEFDRCVQVVRDDKVQGGRAPQLVRADGPVYPVHESLIPEVDPVREPSRRRRV